MPKAASISSFVIFEDGGATYMARFLGNAGVDIQQADLDTIKVGVFDPSGVATLGPALSLTVANVVFDTLQTGDARWVNAGGSAAGFNFLYQFPAASFPDGNTEYDVRLTLTPSAGEPFQDGITFKTLDLPGD